MARQYSYAERLGMHHPDGDQVKRIVEKTDRLVESGNQMVLDQREASRVLRQAEWEAERLRRLAKPVHPLLRFLRSLQTLFQ